MNELDLIYVRHHTDAKSTKISPSVIRYYELTLVLRGCLCYTANGEKIELFQGDAICLPPDTLRARSEGGERSDYISFNFTSKSKIELPMKMEKSVGSDLLLLVAAYDEISRRAYLDTLDTMAKTVHLLACMLLILEDKAKETSYNPLTLKIMEYLHSNFSSKITLEDIGRISFFSPNYCESVFKRETGRSVIDYLLEVRMTEAKKLLAEGSVSLSAVSDAVGFDDYNYFSRIFKKRTGYTPSEYRRITASDIPARAANDNKYL